MNPVTTLSRLCVLILTGLLCGYSYVAFAANPDSLSAGESQTLMQNGKARSYVVRVPSELAQGKLVPLVLVLHGGGGNADYVEQITGSRPNHGVRPYS